MTIARVIKHINYLSEAPFNKRQPFQIAYDAFLRLQCFEHTDRKQAVSIECLRC